MLFSFEIICAFIYVIIILAIIFVIDYRIPYLYSKRKAIRRNKTGQGVKWNLFLYNHEYLLMKNCILSEIEKQAASLRSFPIKRGRIIERVKS